MAYVLVAIGALMAVAGLYVIGYGWIDARYEEYWHALSAGATLTAGGLITLALGFAVRALLQVKAALVTQPVAVASPEALAVEMPVDPLTPIAFDKTEPTIATPETQPPQDLPVSPPTTARERHPLRPRPSAPQDRELVPPVAASLADVEHFDQAPAQSEPPPLEPAAPLFPTPHDDGRDSTQGETDHRDVGSVLPEEVPAARPADDYKLAPPSATEHDLPKAEPIESAETSAPKTLPKAQDWFDRALAAIDEELPIHTPASRSPIIPTLSPNEKLDDTMLEPAAVGSAPALADARNLTEAHDEMPATAPPTAPNSPVIGRYEAEGTSYVMYADGSIEAQSSAGIYRFSSMAELKAFIES